MPSSGRASAMRFRMSCSTSRSASVTMSAIVDFVAATVTPSRRRRAASSPASTAMDRARASSAVFTSPLSPGPEAGGSVGENRVMPENTTHDWSASVDVGHLDAIGRDPATYAPGGATHLLLEVLAYAAEEAAGRPIRKPVMATKDLRFFDTPSEILPDGFPRRGMSVVAALSDWLVHTNRRVEGS